MGCQTHWHDLHLDSNRNMVPNVLEPALQWRIVKNGIRSCLAHDLWQLLFLLLSKQNPSTLVSPSSRASADGQLKRNGLLWKGLLLQLSPSAWESLPDSVCGSITIESPWVTASTAFCLPLQSSKVASKLIDLSRFFSIDRLLSSKRNSLRYLCLLCPCGKCGIRKPWHRRCNHQVMMLKLKDQRKSVQCVSCWWTVWRF